MDFATGTQPGVTNRYRITLADASRGDRNSDTGVDPEWFFRKFRALVRTTDGSKLAESLRQLPS
jgi:hypothetical protein